MTAWDTILIGIAANQIADNQEEFDEIMRDILYNETEAANDAE